MARTFPSMVESLPGRGGNRRFIILGAVALLALGVWGAVRWASAPTFVTLYQDLELKDAAGIEETLHDAGIPMRLGSGGNSVEVPVDQVAEARVALAREGRLVGGRPGLELFDKPAWGMTDFSQRVTYQRALEGELARTIAGIRGVEKAQVHLAIPAPSPLRRKEREGSASVVLALTPGTTLPQETIQGITYVVSNSVEQITSDNVAVMDNLGHLLYVPANGSGTGTTSRQMDLRLGMETALAGKIELLLEPVLGPGRVRAQVTAEMSFDKVDRTVESVETTPAPVDSTAKQATEDVINSRALERSEGSTGKVTRLTAAVLVDEKALRSSSPGDSTKSGVSLDALRAMAGDAIGIDAARGDRLSITAVPFEAEAPPTAGTSSERPRLPEILGQAERLIRPVVGVLAVLLLGILALKTLRLPTPRGGNAGEAPAAAEAARAGTVPAESLRSAAGGETRPDVNLQVVRSWLKQP